MRRIIAFAGRVTKELLRDPLTAIFGLGFPMAVLCLLSAIQANVPVELFAIAHLTPGIAAFGLSFMALFSATLISKDRTGAFYARLCTTPMRPTDYILGYTLPLLPLSLAQGAICYLAALAWGLTPSVHVLSAVLVLLPISGFFIAMGLLCGTLFNDKQVGGICGALLTNLTAWLSGAWFDVKMVGGAFEAIANFLPFIHATELGRAVLIGHYADALPHLWWVLGWTVGMLILSVIVFTKRMRTV